MTDRPVSGVGPRPIDPDEPIHDLGPAQDSFISHGLLFVLNQFWAHGQGYELVLLPDGNLGVKGDGQQLRNWAHVDPAAVDAAMRRARQMILTAQGNNKRNRAPRNASHGYPPERTGDVSGVRFPMGANPTVGGSG